MRPGSLSLIRRMLMVAVLMVPNALLQAQSLTLSTDRDSIVLGDQAQLELTLIAPPGSRITRWPALPDSFNHLEVVGRSGLDSVRQGDRIRYTQQLSVTGFDSGRWVIPPVSAVVNSKEWRSGPLSLYVQPIRLEGSGYNDIREIREAGPAGPNWKRILVFALGLALIVFILYRWWTNRAKRGTGTITVSKGTAYGEAMRAIQTLRQDQLLERGEMKAYYSRLYDIYRVYLGAISGRNMLQQTTDGLLLHLKPDLKGPVFSGTAEALRVCDAVKFAKYLPPAEQGKRTMEQVMDSIEALNRQP